MLLLDVNVLVYAHRPELPQHQAAFHFVDQLVNGDSPFGVPEMAFSSLVRIVTQPAFHPPGTTAQALGFCAAVKSSPRCAVLQPSENHWTIFDRLCRTPTIKGKLVADAYLAAFAIDRDAEWITTDRDFHRFPGLRWRLLSETRSRTNPK